MRYSAMTRRSALALAVILIVAGCGYHFSTEGKHIDNRLSTVFVDTFTNRTDEPYIGRYIRSAFIDEFTRGGRFTITGNKTAADTVLAGTVTRLSTGHVSYDTDSITKEDRVSVIVSVTFRDQRENRIIWENLSAVGRETYRVGATPSVTDTSRNSALKKLSGDFAERIYRNIMSGF